MKAKEFIQLFIPPILYKVKKLMCPPNKRVVDPLPKLGHKGDRMIIIGNGPSLHKSIELYGEQIKDSDSIMVNFAASTELFSEIKPFIYLLVDPAWMASQEAMNASVKACLEDIVSKTSWSMTIVMPKRADGCYATELFAKNDMLHVLFYEDSHIVPKEMTKCEAWDKNVICPPGQTVLNTAVWLAIYWGYRETYLVGADTSWHAELKMDQETNILYTIDTHYYDNKKVYGSFYDEKQCRRPIGTMLHEELYAEATALEEYWELKGYADWKGVKVYNASEYSWIDAFERKKLSKC